MNQNHLQKIVSYNLWANKRISKLIEELDDDKFNTQLVSSFSSIKLTLMHIWDAQSIWFKRLNNIIVAEWPGKNFSGTKSELLQGLINSSNDLEKFVVDLKSEDENKLINYSNLKGEKFSTAISDILIHCINHSTFHRGQIITMLRQVGISNLINTDYITFIRK